MGFKLQPESVNRYQNNENLKQIINNIAIFLEKNEFCEDRKKIQHLSSELKKIENQIPTYNKLDELQKIIIDLEVKYDDFNDLPYYFDPLYVKIKNNIHQEEVKKIREKNKRKRENN